MVMAVPPLDPLTSPFRSTEKNQMPPLICIEPISFPPITCKRGSEALNHLITQIYRWALHPQQEVEDLDSDDAIFYTVNFQYIHCYIIKHRHETIFSYFLSIFHYCDHIVCFFVILDIRVPKWVDEFLRIST